MGMQNQQFEQEAREHGYKPDEYREILRRAQRIRADKEERLSAEALAESAAEVGIREEDLRAAERQLREERAALAQQRRGRMIAGAVAAAVLALVLLFSYGSLNTEYGKVEEARANIQSTLQRRADVVRQLVPLVRESAASEQRLVREIEQVTERLRSGDVEAQLQANQALGGLLTQVEGKAGFRSSEAYRDLMAEISGSENRINVARTRYNQAVTNYNRTARSFPTLLVRPLLGFPGSVKPFEAAPEATPPPAIPTP
jgi:LemA protein